MSKKITKSKPLTDIPLNESEPKEVLNSLSKHFKKERRAFYVGSTHDVEKRKKQHLGVFKSGEMVVVYVTEDREKCLSIETTLINALKINKCSPVNTEKKSKIHKQNCKEYYVYIMFENQVEKEIIEPSKKEKDIIKPKPTKKVSTTPSKKNMEDNESKVNKKELEKVRREALFNSFGVHQECDGSSRKSNDVIFVDKFGNSVF
jgi:predicted GIY-YIG superfamily endonuclease